MEHRIAVHVSAEGAWARCRCGWISPHFLSALDVSALAQEHLDGS